MTVLIIKKNKENKVKLYEILKNDRNLINFWKKFVGILKKENVVYIFLNFFFNRYHKELEKRIPINFKSREYTILIINKLNYAFFINEL